MQAHRGMICAAAITWLLIAVASFLPDMRLWGLNHLAFYPLTIRVIILTLLLATMVPPVARRLYRWISFVPRALGDTTRSKSARVAALATAIAFVTLFSFRSSTNLLGDGQLIGRSFEAAHEGNRTVVMRSARSIVLEEPVAQGSTLLYYMAGKWATDVFKKDSPVIGIRVFLCLLGAMIVYLVLRMVSSRTLPVDLRAWLWILTLFSATMQLYFGYIENYAPLVFLLGVYVALLFRSLNQRSTLWWPFTVLVAACYTHVQGIVFIPSLIVAVAWRVARGKTRDHALRVLPPVLIAMMSIGPFALYITPLKKFLLPLYDPAGYAVFHPAHVADILNELCMLLPVVIVVGGIWWSGRRRERAADAESRRPRENEWFTGAVEWKCVQMMLVANTVYIVFFDAVIGVARDWDLFGMATVALIPATLLSLRRYQRYSGAQADGIAAWSAPALAIVVVMSVAWFGINASPWRTADRFESILEYDKRHGSYASENLAIFYYDNNRLQKATSIIEKTYDTWANPRHAVRVAMYYEEAGRRADAIALLAMVLEKHIAYDRALFKIIELMEKSGQWGELEPYARLGVEHYPREAIYPFYIGEALARRGENVEALEWFLRCSELNLPPTAKQHMEARVQQLRSASP